MGTLLVSPHASSLFTNDELVNIKKAMLTATDSLLCEEHMRNKN
jgi:hypothetical protein